MGRYSIIRSPSFNQIFLSNWTNYNLVYNFHFDVKPNEILFNSKIKIDNTIKFGSVWMKIKKKTDRCKKSMADLTPHTEKTIFPFPFQIEWDMIVVSVFEPNENSIWLKNCHRDHIPFTVKGNGS